MSDKENPTIDVDESGYDFSEVMAKNEEKKKRQEQERLKESQSKVHKCRGYNKKKGR